MTIRNSGVHGQTHSTFEEYCRQGWGFTRQHAGRLINGAKAFENVTPGLQITEKQLRPLSHLEPEKQKEVWKRALETAPQGNWWFGYVVLAK